MNHSARFSIKCSFFLLAIAIWIFSTYLYLQAKTFYSDSDQPVTVNAGGIEIKLYTYRPSCNKPSVLFVFHGRNRKAANARNNAKKIANKECLMVFAPLFDKERFPNWRYHRAGVVRNARVQPQSQWTIGVLKSLIKFSRDYIDDPKAKVYLFGHSAGAQFLSRVMAYTPLNDVDRVILANPSVFVAPTSSVEAPYGFAGIFASKETQRHLESYISLPITVYLGTSDTGDKYLVKSEKAIQQGANRYERGKNIYQMAKQEAAKNKITFGWLLIEAYGVGHSSADMLKSPAASLALGLRDRILDSTQNMGNDHAELN